MLKTPDKPPLAANVLLNYVRWMSIIPHHKKKLAQLLSPGPFIWARAQLFGPGPN